MKTGNQYLRHALLGVGLFMAALPGAFAQLRVDGATADPATVEPGESFALSIGLTNTAPATGTAIAAGHTVSANVTFTHTETGTSFSYTGLTGTVDEGIDADGGTGTAALGSVQVPLSTTDAGEYRVSVTLVADDPAPGPPTTANGSSASPGATALTVTGKPDLVITSLTYPAGISYEGGDTIAMSLTYTNQTTSNGNNNVPYVPAYINDTYFRIEVIISSNPTFGDADDFLLTFHDISTRVNADNVDRTLNWTQLLPGNFPGSFYVLAKIDVNSQVDESIEDDLTQNGNNVWYDVNASRIALDPSNFPTIYWGSSGGDGWSDQPVANDDGRYTVFASDSTNLVTEDTNAKRDIFIYDQNTTTVRRLNLSQQGVQGNADSQYPFISANSASVAFSSDATNLVQNDTNGFSDIFVVATFDEGVISRVNTADDGTQANGSSFRPTLSNDGRYVAFESTATNLVSGGTTFGVTHVYLRDTVAGTTTLVSVDSGGTAGNGDSTQARVSNDGRYVAFASDASNLVSGDTNGVRDVFLRDTVAGTTVRVSVDSSGVEGNGESRSPSVSSDGSFVVFHSASTNLVTGDTNGVNDVFVRTISSGTTTRVSVSSAGLEGIDPSAAGFQLGSFNPSISATGRFVTFASITNNLTDGDSVGQYSSTDGNGALDIFVHDRDVSSSGTFDTAGNIATTMVSRNRFGFQTIRILGVPSTAASDIFPSISANGRWVVFPSDADRASGLAHGNTNRISPDQNGFRDIFVHDRKTDELPNPVQNPTVSITAPLNGSSVALGSTVSVVAGASAPTGTVASVELFVDGISLGVVTSAPYSAEWTPTVAGTYSLTALVIDSFANQGVSSAVTVDVEPTSPVLPNVSITSPAAGSVLPINTPTSISASASDSDGSIVQVEIFANGASLGTVTGFPLTIDWTPTFPGPVTLTAQATDDGGNVSLSGGISVTVDAGGIPSTEITSPSTGTSYVVGNAIPLAANATAVSPASIQQVRFLANGIQFATDTTAPFTASWTPNSLGTFALTTEATDTLGNKGTSPTVSLTITDNQPPTVSLTSPASGTVVAAGTPVSIGATAGDADGTIFRVDFFANGIPIGNDQTVPYLTTWAPTVAGTYNLTARATDNSGNVSESSAVALSVGGNTPPVVSLTSPSSGSSGLLGETVVIEATATDPDGTIAGVEFFANGVSLGTDTVVPFTASWTPTVDGIFTLTATATDNGNSTTNSGEVIVSVTDPNSADTETFYSGSYLAGFERGEFSMIRRGNESARFFARSDDNSRTYIYNDIPVDGVGGFQLVSAGVTVITGQFTSGAVSGQFDGGRALMVGVVAESSAAYTGPSGIVYGSVGAAKDSEVLIAAAPDGKVTLLASKGTENELGFGRLDTSGGFSIATSGGGVVSGTFDPDTGFLSADASGGMLSGSISGAVSSAAAASDGSLRNLSTRGLVGSGDKILVAGFVVSGSVPKQVLVRALGPTLGAAPFNVPGVVTDTSLSVYNTGGAVIASNDNWETDTLAGSVSATVGAYALPSGSLDSAIVTTLSPGAYTAQVSGVSGSTGVGLVEIYDVDTLRAFATNKVLNVSTRGEVGSGAQSLIAGVVINGTTSKRVLIRAVGPTLSQFGVSGALADPSLRLVRQDNGAVVRENNDWEMGNDASAVTRASTQVGAFALPSGSNDACLLITLPPGIYTAIVSSADSSTGIALVEVYEVP